MNNIKIFHVITVSKSVSLLTGQLEYLKKHKFDTHLVSSDGKELKKYPSSKVHIVNMEREISLFKDVLSLIKMTILFLKEQPAIVNSGTPKAGLIGMVASFITRRPTRIYTVRGLRLETTRGIKYKILYCMEKLAMFCSTEIIAISNSLKDKIVELNLAKAEKIIVLGNGSSNGLNLEKYDLSKVSINQDVEKKIKDKFVIGFIGRITKDKGISELLESFEILEKKHRNILLLMIGAFEKGNSISQKEMNNINSNENIIHINNVKNPVNYYNNMDILVFPTHREGFGNVSIEAQALKVPVITYNVTGAKDTVLNNHTGYIIEYKNVMSMTEKIDYLIMNKSERLRMGEKGRVWVFNNFSNEIIWKELLELYKDKMKKK